MKGTLTAERRRKLVLSIVLAVICIIYVLPIFMVVLNSFKLNTYVKTDTFAFPNGESFAGWANYIKGMTFGNYPFWKSAFYSLFITVVSSALILLCTSMAAWYIARVDSKLCRIIYYLCVFSMVVPFQMVMFTLSKTADRVKIPFFNFADMAFDKVALNTPWTIPIIYLGFGAGLAIFMFVGFVKSIPLEIEEAASIDLRSAAHLFFRGVPHAAAYHDLRGHFGDYVGLERLSAALPRVGQHQVFHHSHPHPVPQGQLRHGGPGRDHGAHFPEHSPCHHFLPLLPEIYH